MFLVDTNVFLAAANPLDPKHETAADFLAACGRSRAPWFASWPILFELLRVATHAQVFRRPLPIAEAWRLVEALLAIPSFQVLEPTAKFPGHAAEVFALYPDLAGSVLHDTHTAILMREHGIGRIYTRDRGFRRFRFLDVLDPFDRPAGAS